MDFLSGRDKDSAYIHGHSGWQDLRYMCSGMLGPELYILGCMENVPVSADREKLLACRWGEAQVKSAESSSKDR